MFDTRFTPDRFDPRSDADRGLPSRRGVVLPLLGALIALQILTAGMIIWSNGSKSAAILETHTQRLLSNVVDEARENAQGFLARANMSVELTRGLLEARLLDVNNIEELERFLLEQLRVNQEMDAIYFGAKAGEFIFVKRSVEHPGSEFFSKLIDSADGVRRVRLRWRDAGARLVASGRDDVDSFDARERPWYGRAVDSGRLIWTDPYVFYTSRTPGITAAAPIRGHDGRPAGVIGVDMSLDSLSRFLSLQKASGIGSAVIVHRNGSVIAHASLTQLPRLGRDDSLRIARLGELDALSARAHQALNDQGIGVADIEGPSFQFFSEGGKQHVAMFVPFLDQDYWPWLIGVVAPDERFVGDLQLGHRESTMLAILISITITVVAFFLGPWLLRPIFDLHERATRDPLTHLLNRRGFRHAAAKRLSAAQTRHAEVSLIALSIDAFKLLNDRHGHPVGDLVLQAIAKRLVDACPAEAALGRVSGQQFVVLATTTDATTAKALALRLLGAVRDAPVACGLVTLSVTVSAGVATAHPGEPLDVLVYRADQALLEARRAGKDRVNAALPAADGMVPEATPQAAS